VDYSWAFTTIHPGAIYMVQSEQYHVDHLDWERRKAYVRRVESEYYTDALSAAKVKVLQVLRARRRGDDVADDVADDDLAEYGEVEVVRRALGYKKIKFYTQENLGWGDVILPEDVYHTQAAWFTAPRADASVGLSPADVLDACHGIATLAHTVATFLLMCDGRDLGVVIGDRTRPWFAEPARGDAARGGRPPEPPPERFEPTFYLFDQYSGGIGLAEALHPRVREMLVLARERLAACPCATGCPGCVGPAREVGRGAKRGAALLLDDLLGETTPALERLPAETVVNSGDSGVVPA
jgi:DEAD/DEAH box helicase domain-containing protein